MWTRYRSRFGVATITLGVLLAAVVVESGAPVAGAPNASGAPRKVPLWSDTFDKAIDWGVWNPCPRDDSKPGNLDCWAGHYWPSGDSFPCFDKANDAVVTDKRLRVARLRLSATAPDCQPWYGEQPYALGYLDTEPDPASGHAGFTFLYGYAEVRMKVPEGNGLFPAFWMRPYFPVHGSGGDPFEIDVFEFHGDQPYVAEMGLRVGAGSDKVYCTRPPGEPERRKVAGGYHTYGVDWQPGGIAFYLDGALKRRCTASDITIPSTRSFLILQWQLDSGVLGHPGFGPDTQLPADVMVDYVKVWRSRAGAGAQPG